MGLLDLNDLDTSLSNLYDSKALGDPATQDFSDDDEAADDINSEEAKAAAATLAATCAANAALAATASANGNLKRPPPVVTKPVAAASSSGTAIATGTGTAAGNNRGSSDAKGGRTMSPLAVMTSRSTQGFGDNDEQNDSGNTTATADTVCTGIKSHLYLN
jgi:hypothetical protein